LKDDTASKRQKKDVYIKPVEVQIMKVESTKTNEKSPNRYYLAVNHQSVDNAKEIEKALRSDSLPTEKISEIDEFLKDKKVKEKLKEFRKKVYFANQLEMVKKSTKNKSRHAEEYLCDIADSLKTTEQSLFTFTIYGKKRPCITCTARMRVSGIHDYNPHYGRLFLHALDEQTPEVYHETLKLLVEAPSYPSKINDVYRKDRCHSILKTQVHVIYRNNYADSDDDSGSSENTSSSDDTG